MTAKTADERISELLLAIRPLVKIADEYDKDGLDEARPSWIKNGAQKYNSDIELYCGRGGLCLITLEDALKARDIATNKIHDRPHMSEEIVHYKQLYEAGIPSLGWDEMSEERRQSIINNYKKLKHT